MSNHVATRMCPECMTTDAHFPNIDDCESCASMLNQEEAIFWATPIFMEPQYNAAGDPVGYLAVFPKDIMQQVRIPWYINLARMLMLD